jgi:hypothetical protein
MAEPYAPIHNLSSEIKQLYTHVDNLLETTSRAYRLCEILVKLTELKIKNRKAFKIFLISKWNEIRLFDDRSITELRLFEPKLIGIIHAFMIKKMIFLP